MNFAWLNFHSKLSSVSTHYTIVYLKYSELNARNAGSY